MLPSPNLSDTVFARQSARESMRPTVAAITLAMALAPFAASGIAYADEADVIESFPDAMATPSAIEVTEEAEPPVSEPQTESAAVESDATEPETCIVEESAPVDVTEEVGTGGISSDCDQTDVVLDTTASPKSPNYSDSTEFDDAPQENGADFCPDPAAQPENPESEPSSPSEDPAGLETGDMETPVNESTGALSDEIETDANPDDSPAVDAIPEEEVPDTQDTPSIDNPAIAQEDQAGSSPSQGEDPSLSPDGESASQASTEADTDDPEEATASEEEASEEDQTPSLLESSPEMDSSVAMLASTSVTGWYETDGKTYYLDENGDRLTGLQQLGNASYYFNSDGSLYTGEKELAGKWYYFDPRDKGGSFA